MHIPNIVLTAMTASTQVGTRARRKRRSIGAGRTAACNTTTPNTREAKWVSKSLARITAAWRRRSRPE
jgi:hypothetical protein